VNQHQFLVFSCRLLTSVALLRQPSSHYGLQKEIGLFSIAYQRQTRFVVQARLPADGKTKSLKKPNWRARNRLRNCEASLASITYVHPRTGAMRC